ncbi:M20/M25/M40 family metallo-hydrolase [Thalassobaculum sp. OXR-137]|uniref:M20 family metallopeptidase n=1 Tax=Thalassobaculum sp. OXR-137 TaxID=3100173 RepID=UPI002AC91048|nr:M20/M25/M40 family metallo-hydrolase [Thalassobaculum sp. OXR-137]WPZ36392.1 M20/M25/M40 family metallo-hydrolase [Thalassobaculum sp. OXR-137]
MPTQPAADTVSDTMKAEITREIDARRDEFIALLRAFLRIRSVNPPGDMREAADFVRGILDRFGVPHRTLAAREDMPNIVGRWDAASAGRHLILNGHMDVFPASGETLWAAEIDGDRIVARGASDMKTGTLASILAYGLLHPYRDRLHGALTLTVVSDEQSGGRYGTKYLFDAHEDVVTGDCCLNGEPTGLDTLRFMEKGTLRFSLAATSIGGHGGYPHRAPNPIQQVTGAIHEIYRRFHRKLADLPPEIDTILTSPESIAAADRSLGNGAADNARRITVNAGIIQGGQKATQIPTECTAHLDMRFPVGVDRDAIRCELEALAAEFQVTLSVNEDHSYPASSTDPYGEMATILRNSLKALTGNDAPPVCSLGGTDGRYWRWRGIPTVICGPSNLSMGSDSEHVTLDEAIAVMKLHALCAAEYLSRPAG